MSTALIILCQLNDQFQVYSNIKLNAWCISHKNASIHTKYKSVSIHTKYKSASIHTKHKSASIHIKHKSASIHTKHKSFMLLICKWTLIHFLLLQASYIYLSPFELNMMVVGRIDQGASLRSFNVTANKNLTKEFNQNKYSCDNSSFSSLNQLFYITDLYVKIYWFSLCSFRDFKLFCF